MSESTVADSETRVQARREGWDPVHDWCEVERSAAGPITISSLGPSPLADAIAALEGLEGELARMERELT